ncbi:MAG: GTPase [Promethearchaeota archaeon]
MNKFAIIVQVFNPRVHLYSLKEMEGLAESAGYTICGTVKQNLPRINPKYYLGQGKLNKLKKFIHGFFHPEENQDMEDDGDILSTYKFDDFDDNEDSGDDTNNSQDWAHDGAVEGIFIPDEANDAAVEGIFVPDESSIPNDELLPDSDDHALGNSVRYDSTADDLDLVINFPDNLRDLSELVVIFNNRISYSQINTLSQEIAVVVKDRDDVILEIFETNARTHESKLQIELTRMALQTNIMKKEFGAHLDEKQGRGARGKGLKGWEPQMLHYRKRKKKIREDLSKIASQRNQRRKRRGKMYNVGVVGYTNAGKSTFINTLAGTNLETANHEFTTISPVSRKVVFPNFDEFGRWKGQEVILTDSVGFITDMSPMLIDAFLSTLEELQFSDLLLILVDFSNSLSDIGLKIETTLSILHRINAFDLPKVFALNKMDLLNEADREEKFRTLRSLYPDFTWYLISGKEKASLKTLSDEIVALKSAHFKNK